MINQSTDRRKIFLLIIPLVFLIAWGAGCASNKAADVKAAGAKRAMPLPVSAPFHTELMRPAGEQLQQVLADIPVSAPDIPVLHNVNAGSETDPEAIRSLLVEQIYSPVQWTACIQNIIATGVTHMVECGPGKVLSGLSRRIDKSLQCYSLEEPEALLAAVATLK